MNSRHASPPDLFSGVNVNLFSKEHAIEVVLQRLRAGQDFLLFTLNLDHVVKLRKDRHFLDCYRRADFISADGWPVVWHYRRNGFELERTTGADLVEPLCMAASMEQIPVYFIGPMPEVQAKAIRVLNGQSPNLRIAGAEAPVIVLEDEALLDDISARIRASGGRLCFVSLGAPKQELVAAGLLSRCPGVGFICVGAALDFVAGEEVRAPDWVQKAGLEWFWRLAFDPRRLLLRYVASARLLILMACGASPIPPRELPDDPNMPGKA